MIDKFMKEYNRKVELCYLMLSHIAHAEQTKNFTFDDTKKYLSVCFTQDIINQAIRKTLGE